MPDGRELPPLHVEKKKLRDSYAKRGEATNWFNGAKQGANLVGKCQRDGCSAKGKWVIQNVPIGQTCNLIPGFRCPGSVSHKIGCETVGFDGCKFQLTYQFSGKDEKGEMYDEFKTNIMEAERGKWTHWSIAGEKHWYVMAEYEVTKLD